MNLVLKLLLNSLYGRFGMKIHTTNKKIITQDKLNVYLENYEILDIIKYNDEQCLIEYITKSSISKKNLSQKQTLKDYNVNTAVQIASAITAYSRVHMSEFLNDSICYTDTDSIYKLNNEIINDESGNMKLEYIIKKGVFIAPKLYYIINDKYKKIIKFKGNTEKKN
jgi:hypothetical protein